MEQIFLFLDIDGVVNTSVNSKAQLLGSYQGRDLFGSPSTMVKSFLQAIDQAKHIKPIWMSSGWREHSNIWNRWADIAAWIVGYPISFDKTLAVMRKYGKRLALDEIDDAKTIAVLYHAGSAAKIVWIEDGFPKSALTWVQLDPRVTLINTIHPSDPLLLGIQAWNIKSISQALDINLELFIDKGS